MNGLADPEVYGEGLARVLDAIAERMPKDEVEAVWSFPGVRRDHREYGVAVVTRRGAGDRHIVYRVRYILELKGKEKGTGSIEIVETAEAPSDLLPRVIDGVRDRADEAGEAELVNLDAWRAEAAEETGDDGHREE